MHIEQLTSPASHPVSIDDAKRQCSILDDTHDFFLLSLIEAATRYVESKTGMRLVTQTVRFHADSFDGYMPLYPLQSVDAVAYDSPDFESEQSLSSNDYWVGKYGIAPSLEPVDRWPSLTPRKPGSVRIDATVGYGGELDVPADIKAAILIGVKEMFDVRGESVRGTIVASAKIAMDSLLMPYMRPKL